MVLPSGRSKKPIGSSMATTSKKTPIIFDIRVSSEYKDVILLRGSSMEPENNLLSGHVVFSLPESIHVKKVRLRLVGKFKLEFLQVGQHKNNNLASIVKEEHAIFESNWNNLLIESEGSLTRCGRERPGLSRVRSMPIVGSNKIKISRPNTPSVLELPKNGVSGTPYDGLNVGNGASFILNQGNYELPFKVTLPSNVAETVEGLQTGSILYTFECCIERSGFNKSNFTKYKYLRVFRTLNSDNVAIQEEVYVGKSWPGKLQYEISIPSRAIPIGGPTPINVKLYPFQKGYKLKRIAASLVQFYTVKDNEGEVYEDKNIVQKQSISTFANIPGCDQERQNLLVDQVKINSIIQLPDDLKRVTQDCNIADGLINVRHKLNVVIALERTVFDEQGNAHEQSTEIKVNLPIVLYIMPRVPIQGRLVLLDNAGKIHFRSGELCALFERQGSPIPVVNPMVTRLEDGSYAVNYFPSCDTENPPTYAEHTQDLAMNELKVIPHRPLLYPPRELISRALSLPPSEGHKTSAHVKNESSQLRCLDSPPSTTLPTPTHSGSKIASRSLHVTQAPLEPNSLMPKSNSSSSTNDRLTLGLLPSYDESIGSYDSVSREPTPLYPSQKQTGERGSQ